MKLGPHTRIDRYPPIMHMETRSREHACTAEFLLQSIPTICTKINLSGYCYSFAICKKRFIFLLLSGSRWNIIHAAITCLWRRIFYTFLEKVDFVKDFRKWPLKGRCRETCSNFLHILVDIGPQKTILKGYFPKSCFSRDMSCLISTF